MSTFVLKGLNSYRENHEKPLIERAKNISRRKEIQTCKRYGKTPICSLIYVKKRDRMKVMKCRAITHPGHLEIH